MIISMSDYSKLIAVTNRKLCSGDYLSQLQKVTASGPAGLILREKDLAENAYEELAEKVLEICREHQVPCFLHTYVEVAERLHCPSIHLSIPSLRANKNKLAAFQNISVSCHSLSDVQEAVSAGATQVLLGNIYETDCKAGLPGKGLAFLRKICQASSVPVYAIGGITLKNLPDVLASGAAGGCMMSGFMKF